MGYFKIMSRKRRALMREKRPIKILIAKSGLDGHNRGAKVVTLGLRAEGMKVIYSGLLKDPETIINRALEEEVDVIGISSLAGGHKTFFSEIVRLSKEKGLEDLLIIGGGIIPQEDIPILEEIGVSAIFGPWSHIEEIANYIRENARS